MTRLDDERTTKQGFTGDVSGRRRKRQTKNEMASESAGRPGGNENQRPTAVIAEPRRLEKNLQESLGPSWLVELMLLYSPRL